MFIVVLYSSGSSPWCEFGDFTMGRGGGSKWSFIAPLEIIFSTSLEDCCDG